MIRTTKAANPTVVAPQLVGGFARLLTLIVLTTS